MANEIKQRLKDVDATALIGTTWNPAGLILAKSVPCKRAKAFTTDGVGAAYTWHAFTIAKGGIALSEHLSAVGDQRMVGDTSAFRPLGGKNTDRRAGCPWTSERSRAARSRSVPAPPCVG